MARTTICGATSSSSLPATGRHAARRLTRLALTALVSVAGAATPAAAQSIEVTTGIERRDYSYRFENDSSFDTPFLVPHFFEQRYEVTGPEVGMRVRYRVFGLPGSTAVTLMPERRAFGSDFDTFFQPGGDIATSGTAGDVDLAGVGIEQTIDFITRDDWAIGFRVAWRRDRADFLPADRVVTHTQPPSETREWTTDRERTVSRTLESGLQARWHPLSTGPWSLDIAAHVSPTMHTRLLTQLPDKYPGRDIVFDALAWSAGAEGSLLRRIGRLQAGVWMSIERAGSYRQSARFERSVLAAGVSAAFSH